MNLLKHYEAFFFCSSLQTDREAGEKVKKKRSRQSKKEGADIIFAEEYVGERIRGITRTKHVDRVFGQLIQQPSKEILLIM